MRRAMANTLPAIIQWRIGKNDFYPSFKKGLLNYGQESLEEGVKEKSKNIANYVNRNHLNIKFRKFLLHGRIEDADAVWKSMVLSTWFNCAGVG